jgi:hypothetical protein
VTEEDALAAQDRQCSATKVESERFVMSLFGWTYDILAPKKAPTSHSR